MKIKYLFMLSLLLSGSVYAECEQAKAYYEQAVQAKKSQQYQQALEGFAQSAERCPNYTVFYNQGVVQIKLKHYGDALVSLRSAHNYAGQNSALEAKVFARMALVYTQQNQLQQASGLMEVAYAINKENSPKWMLNLRKDIDLQAANHIASAAEITQQINISKNTKGAGASLRISFNSITFKFNSTEFTPDGRRQVDELAKALEDKQAGLLIGHTDKQGDDAYNLNLSKRRAEAVKDALSKYNPTLRYSLQTQGKGEQNLKYLGDDDSDHQLNRRVDLQLL